MKWKSSRFVLLFRNRLKYCDDNITYNFIDMLHHTTKYKINFLFPFFLNWILHYINTNSKLDY